MTAATSPRRLPKFLRALQPAPKMSVVKVTPYQRSQVFMIGSLLLDYPGKNWKEIIREVDSVASTLPEPIRQQLQSFCSWAAMTKQRGAEELYVETFDHKRRCSLEMTYYATGDTRQRGIALTIFQDLYAATGWEQTSGHLPDYLPSVLELAAKSEGESLRLVEDTIAAHREGIEILHASLLNLDSPWAKIVATVRMVLPDVDDTTFERMQNLIRQGPPAELVGITDLPWPLTPQSASPPGEATPREDMRGNQGTDALTSSNTQHIDTNNTGTEGLTNTGNQHIDTNNTGIPGNQARQTPSAQQPVRTQAAPHISKGT